MGALARRGKSGVKLEPGEFIRYREPKLRNNSISGAAGAGSTVGYGGPPATPAATPYSAEASQFFDRLLTPPTSARATLYAALIDSLVTGGVWAKLDTLDVFAAADQGTSLISLKSASFKPGLIITAGIPSFSANAGWTACGARNTKSIDMTFNPSTAGGNYTQNDAMFACWMLGSTAESAGGVVDLSEDSKVEIYPKYPAATTYWAINGSGAEIATANAAGPDGFWLVQRTASNSCELFRAGVSQATSTNASAALINLTLVSNPVANKIAAFAAGGSLTSGAITAFYNAMNTFMGGL